MGRNQLGRQVHQLFGRHGKKSCYWPICHILSRAAVAILFAALCLLFLIILVSHPGRALIVVLFLLFLVLLGMVC